MSKVRNIIILLSVLFIVAGSYILINKSSAAGNDDTVDPSQWVAVDDLGRTVATPGTGPRKNRYVGIMYWPCHEVTMTHGTSSYGYTSPKPYNLNDIISANPTAKNDPNHSVWTTYKSVNYWWNEPIYGYYIESDTWAMRRQVELLADAGIDFIVVDCTNGKYTWWDQVNKILPVWRKAKNDGVNVPKVVFMLGWENNDNKQELFDYYYSVYAREGYSDFYFYINDDTKPLIIANPELANTTDKQNTFSFRMGVPEYYYTGNIHEEKWAWLSSYPQAVYYNNDGTREMTTVGVALNMTQDPKDTQKLTAMNGSNVMGRSYTASGDYQSYSYTYRGSSVNTNSISSSQKKLYGLNFNQQWQYALERDPRYVLVTGWNEWTVARQAGRLDGRTQWPTTSTSRTLPVENAFPDQFNDEYSRDIEPSKGSLKDNYYYQLVDNIRKFKGTNAAPSQSYSKTIDVKGNINQWNDSNIISYNHYTNSNYKTRNAKEWGDGNTVTYTNNTFVNDIKKAKVSYDSSYIYFYVEMASNISDHKNQLRLLIDTIPATSSDSNANNNYEEFEYLLNRTGGNDNTLRLERSTGGWHWEAIRNEPYKVDGKVLQVAIPRKDLGLTSTNIEFNFKWVDHNLSGGDIMTVYTDGDAAPGGRFAFQFKGSKAYTAPLSDPTCKNVTYNGESQNLVNSLSHVTFTNNTGIDAGSYTVTAKADDGYMFEEGTTALVTTKTLTCEIAKKSLETPVCNSLTYTGSAQTLINPITGISFVNNSGTEIGSYNVTANTDSNHIFSDNTTSKTITCQIKSPGTVELPQCKNLVYNGSNQALLEPTEHLTYTNHIGKNAGSYTVTVATKDGYTFSDSSTTKNIACSIAKKTASVNWENTQFKYDGNNHSPSASINGVGGAKIPLLVTGGTSSVGTHNATASLDSSVNTEEQINNYQLENNVTSYQINVNNSVISPSCKNLTYNGTSQTLINSIEHASISNNTQTNAGEYNVTVTTNSGYAFSDSSTSKTVTCAIAKKNVSTIWSNKIFNYDGEMHVPTAQAIGVSGETLELAVTGGATEKGTHTATASIDRVVGGSENVNNYLLSNTTTDYSIVDNVYDLEVTIDYDTMDINEAKSIKMKASILGKFVIEAQNGLIDVDKTEIVTTEVNQNVEISLHPNNNGAEKIVITFIPQNQIYEQISNTYGITVTGEKETPDDPTPEPEPTPTPTPSPTPDDKNDDNNRSIINPETIVVTPDTLRNFVLLIIIGAICIASAVIVFTYSQKKK